MFLMLEFASVSYIFLIFIRHVWSAQRIKVMWTAVKCNPFFSNIAKISNFFGRKILENKYL